MPPEEGASLWTLRADVAWALVLLRLASLPTVATPKPEVHYFLFDRYFRLSELYRRRGTLKRAERLRRMADWHYERSGHSNPPPAVAVALPVPRRPSFVWAVGRDPDDPNPPEAA
jgi:hypothetical protein